MRSPSGSWATSLFGEGLRRRRPVHDAVWLAAGLDLASQPDGSTPLLRVECQELEQVGGPRAARSEEPFGYRVSVGLISDEGSPERVSGFRVQAKKSVAKLDVIHALPTGRTGASAQSSANGRHRAGGRFNPPRR